MLSSCKLIFLGGLTVRLVGIFTSLLIPETKRKTLEELTGEDQHYESGDHSGADSVDVEKTV